MEKKGDNMGKDKGKVDRMGGKDHVEAAATLLAMPMGPQSKTGGGHGGGETAGQQQGMPSQQQQQQPLHHLGELRRLV